MKNIKQHLTESTQERTTEIINNIAATNSKYKQLTKKITNIDEEIGKVVTQKIFIILNQRYDLNLQCYAIITDILYQQAFLDGLKVRKLLNNIEQQEQPETNTSDNIR